MKRKFAILLSAMLLTQAVCGCGGAAPSATISKKDAENAVSAVIASITESLAGGEKVQIAGFGTFEVRERGERVGRDPRTSAEIVIPASKAPAFKAGKALKESVNK